MQCMQDVLLEKLSSLILLPQGHGSSTYKIFIDYQHKT